MPIKEQQYYLWRAVDADGTILDVLLQRIDIGEKHLSRPMEEEKKQKLCTAIAQLAAKDEKMMDKAIAEAQTAINNGKAGVGALLLWQDEILALAHNMHVETGDITAHAEMVVLREAAQHLNRMTDEEKADLTLYTTLEPCLMCLSAISFVGIKRVVYAALATDAVPFDLVAKGITAEKINPLLTRGEIELVPGVKREAGRNLLAQMEKLVSS